jgi:hypothetical protein
VASIRVLYDVSPWGTETMYDPNPISPSWKVLQSRFGSSWSVTVTVWAGAVAEASFSKLTV